MTAMAGLALLMEGSTVREGKYATNIRRATDWLMRQAKPDGQIRDPFGAGEAGQEVLAHAFAMTFLASVYGEEEDAERRKKLEDLIKRAVRYAGETQKGGWGFDPPELDDVPPTAFMLQALAAVRMAGLPVPTARIAAGEKYLEWTVRPSTRDVAAALGAALSPAAYQSPPARKWLRDYKRSPPPLGEGMLLEYYHLSQAQVAFNLGEEGYAKLFPDSRAEDRITWSDYRARTFAQLLIMQKDDGRWPGRLDPVYETAVYLMILQLENRTLPIHQR
jgi:hypothetical protein